MRQSDRARGTISFGGTRERYGLRLFAHWRTRRGDRCAPRPNRCHDRPAAEASTRAPRQAPHTDRLSVSRVKPRSARNASPRHIAILFRVAALVRVLQYTQPLRVKPPDETAPAADRRP